MQSKDIICVSTHYWHDAWFRKQQFMSRFHALGHRVLYVQPSASLVRRAQGNTLAKNRMFLGKTEKVDDRLHFYYPPWNFPKPSHPLSNSMNCIWQSWLIAKTARSLGMVAPVLWLYRPEFITGARLIPHSKLVFDLVDDLSAYNNNKTSYRFIARCIHKLVSASDLFITTSSVLLDKYGKSSNRNLLVPNGFDSTIFRLGDYTIPEPISQLQRPIVGFIGTLFGFLDYELIEHCVRHHLDKSFVFIGEVEASGAAGVDRLKQYPNTYFLGRKPKTEIPSYVANFDICINPFKIDEVSRSVSPLKVYEYLATGKPVVSAYMEGLSRDMAGPFVTFTNDKESFCEKISNELAADSANSRQRRASGVAPMSWDNLFAQVNQSCKMYIF